VKRALPVTLLIVACGSEPAMMSPDLSAAPPDMAMCTALPVGACVGNATLSCAGGLSSCICSQPEGQWLCCGDALVGCAASQPTQPTEGAACCGTFVKIGGTFSPESCFYGCGTGQATKCDCTNHHWHCVATTCSGSDLGPDGG
jgi:hypothetical protein